VVLLARLSRPLLFDLARLVEEALEEARLVVTVVLLSEATAAALSVSVSVVSESDSLSLVYTLSVSPEVTFDLELRSSMVSDSVCVDQDDVSVSPLASPLVGERLTDDTPDPSVDRAVASEALPLLVLLCRLLRRHFSFPCVSADFRLLRAVSSLSLVFLLVAFVVVAVGVVVVRADAVAVVVVRAVAVAVGEVAADVVLVYCETVVSLSLPFVDRPLVAIVLAVLASESSSVVADVSV